MTVSFRELNIEYLPWLCGGVHLTDEQVKDYIPSGWSMEEEMLYVLLECREPDVDGWMDG